MIEKLKPRLSVLLCTTNSRVGTFLPKIINELTKQSKDRRVELLYLGDNKNMLIARKRNLLVDMAQGEYLVFIDDDDRISPDYISSILAAINTNEGVDSIVFDVEITQNGGKPNRVIYSKDSKDFMKDNIYYRRSNHIMCYRTEVARKVSFPIQLQHVDFAYAKLIAPKIETEYRIDKILYYYDFNNNSSEYVERVNRGN